MRAQHSSAAQGPFSGVRTILVPPDIVAVPRRSPAPVRKRTPWRPQPDGQVRTERSGAREWFSDRLFVDGDDDHTRSGFSLSAAIHVVGAIALAGAVVAQTVPIPVAHFSRSSLVMPALVSESPTPGLPPPPPRAGAPKSAAVRSPSSRPDEPPVAVAPPIPTEAPSTVEAETGAELVGDGAADAALAEGGGLGAIAADSGASGSGSPGVGGHGPYRVGGDSGIRPPRKIKDVKPAYPLSALTGRTRGSVIIEATIGADGKVEHAAVVHSVAALDQAALEAVKQWEYAPSMLNGVAVAVIMLVVVNFTIQ